LANKKTTIKQIIIGVIVLVVFSGCTSVGEFTKTVLGTSIRALEDARFDAESRSYSCSFDVCFDAILSLGFNEDAYLPETKKYYKVFLKDRIRSVIIVMGIPGHVDTTEVGIFLEKIGSNTFQIEVSSLSSGAKLKVAEKLFAELDFRFEEKL